MKKKLLSIAVSLAVLAILYTTLDAGALRAALADTDPVRLALALALLIGLVMASALRLQWLGSLAAYGIGAGMALKATFAANALNMVLPGKLGDLLKAGLLIEGREESRSTALAVVVWEKIADLAVVFIIGAGALELAGAGALPALAMLLPGIGLIVLLTPAGMRLAGLLLRGKAGLLDGWRVLTSHVGMRGGAGLLALTLAIWVGHFVQICLLLHALGVTGEAGFWLAIAGIVPLIVLAGLVPLTFAGIGTRDAAIVVLLGPMVGAETAAALGILFWLRYLVPGVLGLVFLPAFLRSVPHLFERRKAGP